MSKNILSDMCPHICQTCEYSLSGRNADERTCYNVCGIRMILFGPRFVKWNHTCSNWSLNNKVLSRER